MALFVVFESPLCPFIVVVNSEIVWHCSVWRLMVKNWRFALPHPHLMPHWAHSGWFCPDCWQTIPHQKLGLWGSDGEDIMILARFV